MNLFVDKNEEIVVNLYVYRDEKSRLISWTKNIPDNKPENIDEKLVESFTIVFRLPNYKDSVELVDSGIQFSSDGGMKISSGAVSFGRFTKLLKSWDFKDKNGDIVPPNSEHIGLLETSVANSIVSDLERQIS